LRSVVRCLRCSLVASSSLARDLMSRLAFCLCFLPTSCSLLLVSTSSVRVAASSLRACSPPKPFSRAVSRALTSSGSFPSLSSARKFWNAKVLAFSPSREISATRDVLLQSECHGVPVPAVASAVRPMECEEAFCRLRALCRRAFHLVHRGRAHGVCGHHRRHDRQPDDEQLQDSKVFTDPF
jgi:hypothetical protein